MAAGPNFLRVRQEFPILVQAQTVFDRKGVLMKFVARALLAIVCPLTLFAADTPTGSDILNRWVGGKWVGSGEFVASDFSQANKSSATTTSTWSPDHIFVVCDQDINFGGTPMRDLSIYTFSPKTNKFYFYAVSLGQDKPRSADLAITGGRWVYSSSNRIKAKTVEFRTVDVFRDNDNVEWWSEFSTDGGKTWTKTGSGKETRQK
jgi:hypothetical protein